MDFIHTQMRQIPDQVAEVSHPNFIVYSMFAVLNHSSITKFIFLLQRLLEKLNKSGVMYKPAAAVPSVDRSRMNPVLDPHHCPRMARQQPACT